VSQWHGAASQAPRCDSLPALVACWGQGPEATTSRPRMTCACVTHPSRHRPARPSIVALSAAVIIAVAPRPKTRARARAAADSSRSCCRSCPCSSSSSRLAQQMINHNIIIVAVIDGRSLLGGGESPSARTVASPH